MRNTKLWQVAFIGIILFVSGFVSAYNGFVEKEIKNEFSLESGLVGYWHFDEGEGNTVHDGSGNGNHGAIYGANWTTGVSGSALDFNGVGDYVRINSNFGLTDHWTFATWVKVHSQDPGIIISLPYTYIAAGIELGTYHKENKTFRVRNYHTLEECCIQTSLTDITDGGWYHCVATYDGVTQKIFVNGIEEGSNPMSNSSRVAYGKTYIGAFSDFYNDGWNGLNGIIDEVRIYNRALNNDEIKELYNNPALLKWSFLFGRIDNLNANLGNIITFDAVKLRVIQLFPFQFLQFSSGEQIRVSKDKIGFINLDYVFGFFQVAI